MKPKVRNHFASLCMMYVKSRHNPDYQKLLELAEGNYPEGYRHLTLSAVFGKFLQEKQLQEQIDVL